MRSDKPFILVSKCLGFDSCRYDGAMIRSEGVDLLKEYVNYIPICPEMGIGLGVPREPIRIVQRNNKLSLIQPATKRDLTARMKKFCEAFLNNLGDIDGAILKAKSPTCGIRNVKIFSSEMSDEILRRGVGLFAYELINKFPLIPIVDEREIETLDSMEHFFLKIFSLYRFKEVKKGNSYRELINYHTKMKYLLMAYNQEQMRSLGRIVANKENISIKNILNIYEKNLAKALEKKITNASHINVLYHMVGYFKDKLTKEEKAFFEEELIRYKKKKSLLYMLIKILNSWINKYGEEYLRKQYYIELYTMLIKKVDVFKAMKK